MNAYEYYAEHILAGGESAFEEIFRQAYEHIDLLRGQPYEQALAAAADNTAGIDFDEVTVRTASGHLVGYAAVALDVDIHVGTCLNIIWCWVHPEHTGKTHLVSGLHTKVAERAKQMGIPYSYTRTDGMSIITKYRGVKRG